MKRIIIAAFIALLPVITSAQVTFPNRGGTGTTTIPTAGQVLIGFPNGTYGPVATSTLGITAAVQPAGTNGQIQINSNGSLGATSSPSVGFINATRTDVYSTLPRLSVTTAFNFLGTVITDVSAWFAGLFDSNFASKTTTDLLEGSNLYYLDSRARSAISETVEGIQYATSTGVLSLTTGYVIPSTTRAANWDTAFSWGNHASAGYLTAIATTTVRNMLSANSPLSYVAGTGVFSLSTAGDWSGTFDNQEGSYYLSRANHTGTQLASTISDLTTTVRGLISSSATGLTYTSGTGALSLTSGYVIPLTASTTEWSTFYGTPSTRITAGTGLSWSGNTLNSTGGGGSVSTSTVPVAGQLALWTSPSALSSVATGTLTETVSGLQFDATRGVVGGSAVLSLTSGYEVPLTASTTDWQTAYSWGNHATQGYLTVIASSTVRNMISETITGLDYTAGTGVFSTTAGYVIPLTASTTEWATAYASTTNLTPAYIRGLFSASSPITYNNSTGAFTFSTAGDWTGTFDSLEGSAYLNRTNHTGTQLASTISDFTSTARGTISETITGLTYTSGTGVLSLDGGYTIPLTASTSEWATAYASTTALTPTYIRNLFSESVTGLDYTAGTGVTSLTTGYMIPLSASTTNWNTFYDTPSNRITANDGLTWSGNNLNFDGGNAPGGELGGTWASPTIDDGLAVTNFNLTTPTLTSFFGTPCTGNQFLQDISDTGAFTCVEAAGGSGGGLATTSPWTLGNLAYVTGAGTVGSVATTTLVAGDNISFTGGTPVIIGSSPITISSTGGGGGGGALSTTTDTIGAGGSQLVSYVTGDVMFGGSSSTTAEFQLDDDGAIFIISSSSANATSTIESNNNAQAVRLGDDSGVGLEWFFGTVGDAIVRTYGNITRLVVAIGETLFQGNVTITGHLEVATTTYHGATTSDALIVDGHTNSGEWISEFCTTPAAETTQITVDGLKGCGRYSYLEDTQGVIDFVSPSTATSSYFRLRAGTAGTATAAGDGIAIGWATGIRSANLWRSQPAMEWTMRQDYAGASANATSSLIFAGITDKVSVTVDTATEPGEGFYVIATTTTPNYVFACNPNTGGTTYISTGIATSTSVTAGANSFVHFRLEIATSSISSNHIAILKARTASDQAFTQVGACAINNGSSNALLAPIIAIGKSTAGTSMEVHTHFLRFWYRNFVF